MGPTARQLNSFAGKIALPGRQTSWVNGMVGGLQPEGPEGIWGLRALPKTMPALDEYYTDTLSVRSQYYRNTNIISSVFTPTP